MLSLKFLLSSKCLTSLAPQRLARFMSTVDSTAIPIVDYKLHNLEEGPTKIANVTRDEALLYLKEMHTIRRMETTAGNLYKEKAIRGFCHLYSGQEAVAIGIEAAVKPGDSLITSYRCHGFAYTRGGSVYSVLAELCGRSTGVSRARGGSMHLYGKDFYGGNGIVGSQVPLGTGLALAYKTLGKPNVSIALYGDGAANQGQVFESFNLAKIFNLPIIFLCENNQYGMGTSAQRSSASTLYYTRGDYIPGLWVDGMDVVTVREAIAFAREWCVSGKGPIIVETETYRFYGHSMSDPGTSYRTREEVQSMRKDRDPITIFTKKAIDANLVTAEEIKAMEKKIRQEIDASAEKAKSDPIPPDDFAFDLIHSKNPHNFKVRGCDLFSWK